jgi:hypothetical protein
MLAHLRSNFKRLFFVKCWHTLKVKSPSLHALKVYITGINASIIFGYVDVSSIVISEIRHLYLYSTIGLGTL